ncbi:hypothetical protein AX17_003594 [Amanita inopinata Kibby_2008]|nr:hypothetical protein AX17_003594 [Amanita inopinata Kibby_2008]
MRGYHICILVHQKQELSQSHPPRAEQLIPRNIFSRLPAQKPKPTTRRSTQADPLSKDYRFGPIRIDWMDIEGSNNPNQGISWQNRDRGRGPAEATFIPDKHTKSGSTNLPEGVVHVFRDSASILSSEELEATRSTSLVQSEADSDGVILGVLAVPSRMTPSDFLAFVAPASEGMSHIRIIRDTAPNRSIVLIKFANPAQASEFSDAYNGKPFDSMQPEICHVVHVLSIRIQPDDLVSQAISRLSSSQGSMYELPTCPVCLERMDSAVTGLVTVPCSHTFHCMCLSKWGDSRCPVCRYSQNLLSSHPPSALSRSSMPIPFANPSTPALSVCSSCSSTTNLWICLICGNIGCGRYGRAHAHAHYQTTTHLYALELETQRVWDYAGDGYVHRLIQNKADGKLVELPSAASSTAAGANVREGNLGPSQADALTAEKIEAIGIEYSYLLTSQLDSQRSYYEEQAAELRQRLDELREMMDHLTRDMESERIKRREEDERRRKDEEKRIAEIVREKSKAEQRAEKESELARRRQKQLEEEQAVNRGLVKNLSKMRERVECTEKDKDQHLQRIQELEDQVRDVMFFLEARNKIENGNEVAREAAGGSIEVSPSPKQTAKKKSKK